MSTHKTEHMGLHTWEPEDDFLRSEFNENFTALDEAARVVTGTYTGDNASQRTIKLGFTPSALLVFTETGYTYHTSATCGGLALRDVPVVNRNSGQVTVALEIVEGGFIIRNTKYYSEINNTNLRIYIAFR